MEEISEPIMAAPDVIELCSRLEKIGIIIWIDGGWAVDALLGEQTRPHKDLDIAIQWKDVPKLYELLAARGYRQIKEDSKWNFVLSDDQGHEIDVHAFVFGERGNVVEGIMYPPASLTGTGSIDGQTVRCISPEYMVRFLTPWIHKWPEKYVDAVSRLCKQFGIKLPQEYTDSLRSQA
ncbi:MAG TPA: nucleotidyltransferase family protein [Blastocatellia bacterium]|nr:nucleotidyltransferase family protein [Blastocatellia bacterium]